MQPDEPLPKFVEDPDTLESERPTKVSGSLGEPPTVRDLTARVDATCPKCGKVYDVPGRYRGKPVRCRPCNEIFIVP
jgi:hypothetical protein